MTTQELGIFDQFVNYLVFRPSKNIRHLDFIRLGTAEFDQMLMIAATTMFVPEIGVIVAHQITQDSSIGDAAHGYVRGIELLVLLCDVAGECHGTKRLDGAGKRFNTIGI